MLRQSECFGPRRLPAVDLEDVIASPADLDSIEAIELPPEPIDFLAEFVDCDLRKAVVVVLDAVAVSLSPHVDPLYGRA